MKSKQPTVLVILDGFGYSEQTTFNAIAHARTPHIDRWLAHYPNTTLQAAGFAVGLPKGSIGNSEVGHLTIGSGRVMLQPVTIIDQAIADKTFFKNQILVEKLKQLEKHGARLHLMGLLSDARVHSHENHLYALLQSAKQHNIANIFVHPFLDGRDVPPQSAHIYLQHVQQILDQIGIGTIGSIHGRFYAMDRDKNWERIEQSYRVLTTEQEINYSSAEQALQHYYQKNITDEFIPPTQLKQNSIIQDGDGIIFFNFRPDRARQLTASFADPAFKAFKTQPLALSFFMTPVAYNDELPTDILFEKPKITHTLKEVLSDAGKTILAIAETEKYAHVTYFFSGGHEDAFKNETQVLIPSIPAATYVEKPTMSALQITQAVLQTLKTDPFDFYLINYANADMVGHSGNLDATIKAIECLDEQLGLLYDQIVAKMNGTLYITADHGNAEDMFNKDVQQPRTAHTTNPVPFIMIRQNVKDSNMQLPLEQLADIAPFILSQMKLEIPKQMK